MATNNTALTIASTVDSLIGGFRSHLLGRSLPAPAFVHLDVLDRQVSVYPGGGLELVTKLGNLLLWAHTLTEVTAEWWRTDGDRLHVMVCGRTSGGLRMEIHCGGDFDQCTGLVALGMEERDGVSLDELYALVCLLREQALRGWPRWTARPVLSACKPRSRWT
jgi:hypothetical protein